MKEKTKSFWRIGFSSAASWAWGTSLIMGQEIAQTKGLEAFFIWAICNSLTLALFGFLHSKKIIKPEVYNSKIVKGIALIIQLFCLLVQLNFINQQFSLITGSAIAGYAITVAIGFAFVLIVFKKGLPTSIKTDVWQWIGAIVSILIIIGIGVFADAPQRIFAETTGSHIMWGVWSGLILFAGPIGDIQHWQRAEADVSKKGYYLGAAAFAVYMLLILAMAYFQFTTAMNVILLIAVLCVTTSTIDSIAVATHKLGNKKIGTLVCLAMCVLWGLFVEMGMVQLWSSFGVIRFVFAITILLLPLCKTGKLYITIPALVLTLATIIIFAVFGQITINSIFGAISFAISLAVLGYVVYEMIKGFKSKKQEKVTIEEPKK